MQECTLLETADESAVHSWARRLDPRFRRAEVRLRARVCLYLIMSATVFWMNVETKDRSLEELSEV